MKIYTKTGDTGETSLFGGGRVLKSSGRIAAYGGVDELNSFVGFARAACSDDRIAGFLERIQNELFTLGADLATPLENTKVSIDRITESHVAWIEQAIDALDGELGQITYFILPGGSELASRIHLCRTVCRRAETSIVDLAQTETLNEIDVRYVNRLSDFFFVLARYANHLESTPDIPWKKPNDQ